MGLNYAAAGAMFGRVSQEVTQIQTDLQPVIAQITALDAKVSDLAANLTTAVTEAISEAEISVDLDPVHQKLDAIVGVTTNHSANFDEFAANSGGQTDLTQVFSKLDTLQSLIEGIEQPDMAAIQLALNNIQTALEAQDAGAVLAAIAELRDAGVSVDLSAVEAKLDVIDLTTRTHSENFDEFIRGILGV